jgi:ketosteroid isomerase-like protein
MPLAVRFAIVDRPFSFAVWKRHRTRSDAEVNRGGGAPDATDPQSVLGSAEGGAAVIDRKHLEELVVRFTEAFNREDLEEVLSLMSEDAVYDEFDGRRNRGKQAIRDAFIPQFRGDFGRIRFHTEDLFVDERTGKALVRWRCEIDKNGRRRSWRGLDILHVRDGLVTEKHTYAKAERLRLTDAA